MHILKETKILFLIGLLDLLFTLVAVNLFGVEEENQLFRGILAKSPALFAFSKIAFLLLCLFIIEFIRQKGLVKRQTVRTYLRSGITAYIGLWALLIVKINIIPLLF